LHNVGGWYVDKDVLCFKALDMEEEYVFRKHFRHAAVGNIIKCPKGSAFTKDLYEETKLQINKDNACWELPHTSNTRLRKILSRYVMAIVHKIRNLKQKIT